MVIGRVFDFSGGVPSAMQGCFYYVKEKMTLPVAELVGVNIQQLQQMAPQRVNLKESVVEFIGPLTLSLPPSTRMQHVIKVVVAVVAFLFVLDVSFGFLVDPADQQESPMWYKITVVNAFVNSFSASFWLVYFLDKTSLCQARVTLLPPGSTFVKSWWGRVQLGFAK